MRPKSGRGISVSHTGDGTQINLSANLKGGSASSESRPWDIYVENAQGEEGNISYTLKVMPGTLAGILPSNWDDEFTVNGDGLFYGIARVTTDGEYISAVEIDIASQPPLEQEAVKFGLSTEIDIVFGLFKEGSAYNVVNSGNINVRGQVVLVTTPETLPAVGQPMFDLYFKLQ